jgi:hypothetical protein
MVLEPPMEILELAPGESRAMTVLWAEEGRYTINPRDGRPPKEIPVLRLHVQEADRPFPPYYYDITSLRAQALLKPVVLAPGYVARRFTITKVGSGPSAGFTVGSSPA